MTKITFSSHPVVYVSIHFVTIKVGYYFVLIGSWRPVCSYARDNFRFFLDNTLPDISACSGILCVKNTAVANSPSMCVE